MQAALQPTYSLLLPRKRLDIVSIEITGSEIAGCSGNEFGPDATKFG